MELRTPEPETIEVTDIDLVSDSGAVLSLTLGPDDTTQSTENDTVLYTLSTGEEYEVSYKKIFYARFYTRKVVKPAPVLHPAVPPSAPQQSSAAIDNLQVTPAARTDRPR